MATPTSGAVTPTTITLTFAYLTAATDIGRTPITNYYVEWDQGTGTFVQIGVLGPSDSTTWTYTSSSVIIANTNVNFRMRAANGVGYGAYSGSLTVLTCGVPTTMNPPSTTAAYTYPNWIYLTWTAISASTDTGRSPATFYDL